jgi:hypothetical protein
MSRRGLGKFAARRRYRAVAAEAQCPVCAVRVPLAEMGRFLCRTCEAKEREVQRD